MADIPILFSGPMVCALLDGRKTQTRRLLKLGRFEEDLEGYSATGRVVDFHGNGRLGAEFADTERGLWSNENPAGKSAKILPLSCSAGDRLWVRETAHYRPNAVAYSADNPKLKPGERVSGWGPAKPSIFMPRWASRLTLTVTNVRVERLQDISEEDAMAEGASAAFATREDGTEAYGHRIGFHILWDSLNAKRGFGWNQNPWVTALTFAVHHSNIDALNANG